MSHFTIDIFSAIICLCAREGEAEIEKGPVDLFPAEPTEAAFTLLRLRTLRIKEFVKSRVSILEDLGIIKRYLKSLNVGGMHLSNVMFIELLPDILEKLTFSDGRKTDSSRDADKGHNKNVDTPLQKGNMVNTNTEIPMNGNGRTYTKTTTKTSTKSNIRTSCVRNFNERHYSDEEWKALELKLLNR